jgi:predicted phosphodiesterase
MYTRIIGDTHGKLYDYQAHSIADFKGPSIQVGDFGIGFSSDYWHDNVAAWQEANPQHRFIRGNHDDPARCKAMPGYIADGTIENATMFIGGAWSIDRAWRTEGVSWWADEECSIEQFNQLIDTYSIMRPRVMITHDCPTEAAIEMFQKTGLLWGGTSVKLEKTRTASALQAMYEIHQPDFWFFGHWHISTHLKLGNTHFQCLGELDYIDFDLDSLEFYCE